MEYKTALLLKNWKVILTSVGAVVAPASLAIGYHSAKLKFNRLDLDILELERHQQSYVEFTDPLIPTSESKGTVGSSNDDFSYIYGPNIWRKIRVKRGPKYWAKIARTCGPLPRAFAIEILSRYHHLSEGVYYSTGLACDDYTLIALARTIQADMRYFIPPRRTYDESKHLSQQLYEFMRRLPADIDSCTKFYVDILLGRSKHVDTEDGENDGTSVDDGDYSFEFSSIIAKPRRAELSPPVQSLASLTSSTLDVIWHHTVRENQRRSFVYDDQGLQLLTRIWFVFSSNETMMCKLAGILVSLTEDKEYHSLLVSGGFLHMLASWIRSSNNELKSTAATALANLASDSSTPPYKCGVYLFHPIHKQNTTPSIDVVFIHGVNGASNITWRQHGSMTESADYTSCWPMDWLGEEFGNTVRLLGVDYTSNATYWDSECPHKVENVTIQDQAKMLADKLTACGLGERGSVVWVGHSLGGLIIKQILKLSEEHERYRLLLDNTRDITFIGTPHRGCPVAQLSQRHSYIAYPTLQIQELADKEKLTQLDNQFSNMAAKKQIVCRNFIEGAKTQAQGGIKVHIVPPEYAELSIGENVILEKEDHVTICKPRDRESELYKSLVHAVQQTINEQATSSSANINPQPAVFS